MAKKKKILMMPVIHSKFNDKNLEESLLNKSKTLLTKEKGAPPSYIFLSGSFFDVKGFVYTGLRAWKGAVKPSASDRQATFYVRPPAEPVPPISAASCACQAAARHCSAGAQRREVGSRREVVRV